MPLRKPPEAVPVLPSSDAAPATDRLTRGATEDVRRNAVAAVAMAPGGADRLAAALLSEPARAVRAAIATALAGIATPAAATALASGLQSTDAGLRAIVTDALRGLGAGALAALLPLLDSPDAELRLRTVGLLDAVPPASARPPLLALLAHDPELNVGLAVVEALAAVGGPEDVPALRAFAARHPDVAFAGFAVDLACARLGATDGA